MNRKYALVIKRPVNVNQATIIPGSSVYIRAAKVPLVQGVNTISFTQPLPSAGWLIVTAFMVLANGSYYEMKDILTSPTINGFITTVPEAGDMTYVIMLPTT